MAPWGVLLSPGSEFNSETHTRMPLTNQLLSRSATKIEYRRPRNPPQDKIKPNSYASTMQVSCTLCSDIGLNNTKLGSLRQV